jgi:hypothetical protein
MIYAYSGLRHNSGMGLDVRGSVHHSIIHKKKSNKIQKRIKIFISYLYEAQRVSRDTPSIIRSLKLY